MHARMCDVGQEKDAKPWARERFQALLCGMEMTDGCEAGVRAVRATTVLKCDGEAYVNKRKGKIIPGYELDVVPSVGAGAASEAHCGANAADVGTASAT